MSRVLLVTEILPRFAKQKLFQQLFLLKQLKGTRCLGPVELVFEKRM